MNIIKTNYFDKQLNKLKKKFPKIEFDYNKFIKIIKEEPFSDLGNFVYKYRIKNSSIPVGKRSGFRIIILNIKNDTYIPLIIYSKNEIENVSDLDIICAKEYIINELNK